MTIQSLRYKGDVLHPETLDRREPLIIWGKKTAQIRSSGNLLDLGLKLLHVTTNHTVDLFAILEQHKGRHSVNAQLPRNTLQLVHVHLDKTDVLVLFAQLADNGSNGLARATPGCEEVDDDGAGGGEGFEDDLAVERKLEPSLLVTTPKVSYLSISVTFP